MEPKDRRQNFEGRIQESGVRIQNLQPEFRKFGAIIYHFCGLGIPARHFN